MLNKVKTPPLKILPSEAERTNSRKNSDLKFCLPLVLGVKYYGK